MKDSLASLSAVQLPSATAALEEPSKLSSTSHDSITLLSESTMEGSGSRDMKPDQNEQDGNEDLHLLIQELREERDHHMQLAERGRKELEGEKRSDPPANVLILVGCMEENAIPTCI
jgi:hypothetical protein